MLQFHPKRAKLLPSKDQPACTKQLITDHCGQKQRLLPDVLDYIRTLGYCTTLEDVEVRDSNNGDGFISCLPDGGILEQIKVYLVK